MGSTSEHREPGLTNLEWLRQNIGGPEYGEILDAATVNNSVIYAAWKLGTAHGDSASRVVGLVVYIHWTRDWFNFTHKMVTDSMGPGDFDCPARILDLLDEPENEWAAEWREGCRKRLAQRARARQVKPGSLVRFARPISFADGAELAELTFEKGSSFRAGYGRYRISGWRTMEFTVEEAA